MIFLDKELDQPYPHLSYLYEGIYTLLCSIIEYKKPNIYNNSYTTLIRAYQNTVSERVLIMSNIQTLKCIGLIGLGVIFLIVLYFMFLYSQKMPKLNINFKKLACSIHLIILIIIIDIIPYLLIYPAISGYTYVENLGVLWNTSQYLLILIICIGMCYHEMKKRLVINTIILCSISYYVHQIGFSKYFYSYKTNFGDFFTNSYSNIILYFTPMLFFIRDLFINKVLMNEINFIIFMSLIYILEGIILITLRIIFHPNKAIFFEGLTLQEGFYSALIFVKDFINYYSLSFELLLLVKAMCKPIGQIGLLIVFFFGVMYTYPAYGYTIISIAANAIDLIAYIIIIIGSENIELPKPLFINNSIPKKSKNELVEEDDIFYSNENKNYYPTKTYSADININLATPSSTSTSNDLMINDPNTITSTPKYNYEEEIAELEEEILMYKNDKTSLENQLLTLRSENDNLKNEINNLKSENSNILSENDNLMTNLAKIEIEIEKYQNS